jgi:hypothetical protein
MRYRHALTVLAVLGGLVGTHAASAADRGCPGLYLAVLGVETPPQTQYCGLDVAVGAKPICESTTLCVGVYVPLPH